MYDSQYPVVISMTFNSVSQRTYLQKRELLYSTNTLIYSFSVENLSQSYWTDIFGGYFKTYSNAAVTVTVGGVIFDEVFSADDLINSNNVFYRDNFTIYVKLQSSNTNTDATIGYANSANRLLFVNAVLDNDNPSKTEIDGQAAYPVLGISSIEKSLSDSYGGIALINTVSFDVQNYKDASFTQLKNATGSTLYNAVAEIYINHKFINQIDKMQKLFKGFISDFGYSLDSFNFTVSDFRIDFGNILLNAFDRNDYQVANATYEDSSFLVPYLWGSMEVELIEIASQEVSETSTLHYYIAIDKDCNSAPFDLTKVYDDDHNVPTQLSLYTPYILLWNENTNNTEPKTAYVTGNTTNKVLDIIKQLFLFQRWNWDLEVDIARYETILYSQSPRVNYYVDDDRTTKEIITDVCLNDQLYIFTNRHGKITFGHYPAYQNNLGIVENDNVWFIDSAAIINKPAVSYSDSYTKFCSQIQLKHNQVASEFTKSYTSIIYKSDALAKFNKSRNATIEVNLADINDIALFAKNYFKRFNSLYARIEVLCSVPVYKYQLLDIIQLNLTSLGFQINTGKLWVIVSIDYIANSLILEELPISQLNFEVLQLDEIDGTLDTDLWSVDQDI